MPRNINTIRNEGAPTLSADGRSLVFVARPDESGQNYGANRRGRGSCDLFYTKKVGNKWLNPINIPGAINSASWETQPSLSADGKTLYFIREIKKEVVPRTTQIFLLHISEKMETGTLLKGYQKQ